MVRAAVLLACDPPHCFLIVSVFFRCCRRAPPLLSIIVVHRCCPWAMLLPVSLSSRHGFVVSPHLSLLSVVVVRYPSLLFIVCCCCRPSFVVVWLLPSAWSWDRGTGAADVHAEVLEGELWRIRGPGRGGRVGTLLSLLFFSKRTPVLPQLRRVRIGREGVALDSLP